jgi:hypothetical protein
MLLTLILDKKTFVLPYLLMLRRFTIFGTQIYTDYMDNICESVCHKFYPQIYTDSHRLQG